MIDQLFINTTIKEEQTFESSERALRSVAKAISWRVIGTIDTVLISWLITGTLSLAFSIGLVELATKTALYFFHERAWNTIKWGK